MKFLSSFLQIAWTCFLKVNFLSRLMLNDFTFSYISSKRIHRKPSSVRRQITDMYTLSMLSSRKSKTASTIISMCILLLLIYEKASAKDYVFSMHLQDVMQSCYSTRKKRNKLRGLKIVFRFYRYFSRVLMLT